MTSTTQPYAEGMNALRNKDCPNCGSEGYYWLRSSGRCTECGFTWRATMGRKEAYFHETEKNARLADIAWQGYLEAGKAHGKRDFYLAGSELDAAYKRGWDKCAAELEAA